MGHHGKKRLLPLGVGTLGVAVAVLLLIVSHRPLVKWWYRLQLDRAGPEERWELAGDYEESGAVAREAAEDWYLDVLRSWKPDEVAISSRDPSRGIWVRPSPKNGTHSWGSFHYPDEKDVATAAARLGAIGSVKAIPLLVAHLERSNPQLPLLEITGIRISRDGIPSRGPLHCLHATSLALFELGAESIDALIKTAGSKKPNARIQAVFTLSLLFEAGVAGERALDAILAGYCGEDQHLRSIGRGVLRKLATSQESVNESVLTAVVDCLRGNPSRPGDISRDLVILGASDVVAGAALNAALGDRTLPERSRAALISGLAGWMPAYMVESALRDLLKDESRDIRVRAVRAVRGLGCRAPKTIVALARVLSADADREVT